jgi:hypothetical protein
MPISEAPLRAADNLLTLDEQLRAFIAVARVKAADGITLAEFAELGLAAMRVAIATVDALAVPGAEKRAAVLASVGVVFDALAGAVVVPPLMVPLWIVARPAIRSLALALAAGALETLLPLVRVAG